MVRASSPYHAHFLPELFMATEGHEIRRAKASSLAKSSGLATDSHIHSQRSPRPWAIGCSTPFQSSVIDGSRHPSDLLTPTTVRSPKPSPPSPAHKLFFLSKERQSLFPLSSAIFIKILLFKNSPALLPTKQSISNFCKNVCKPF